MKYDSFKYLFPPRPETAIAPDFLDFYENRGWVAQFKKNGTNTIISLSPKKEFIAMNRHQEFHKAWGLTEHIKEELLRLFGGNGWVVLVAEIMHSKTKTIKDTIFIHDLLVYESQFLIKTSFIARQILLDQHLKTSVETDTHYVCDTMGKVWYAKKFTQNFKELFYSIKDPTIDEGLVLKNPIGQLTDCAKPTSNSGWQVKVRHSSKKYNF